MLAKRPRSGERYTYKGRTLTVDRVFNSSWGESVACVESDPRYPFAPTIIDLGDFVLYAQPIAERPPADNWFTSRVPTRGRDW